MEFGKNKVLEKCWVLWRKIWGIFPEVVFVELRVGRVVKSGILGKEEAARFPERYSAPNIVSEANQSRPAPSSTRFTPSRQIRGRGAS